MILNNSYKEDIVEFVKRIPNDIFTKHSLSKDTLLADTEIVENLWLEYQKLVEEYDCDQDWSLRETVFEILKIDIRNNIFIGTSEETCIYIRDMMVQLVTSLTIMLQKANWTVCEAEKIVSENSDMGITLLDGFCGYSISYFSPKTEIESILIPAYKDDYFAVFVKIGAKRKVFSIYDIYQNINVLIDIHEYIRKQILESEKNGKE